MSAKQLQIGDIPSPALLFNAEDIDYNLDLMVSLAGSAERLRPHVKTHKCPQIVSRHLDRGITRFKCATIAETEMVAIQGARSIVLAKQAVGPDICRLIQLSAAYPETEFLAIVDNLDSLKQLNAALKESSQSLGVLVDVDCGMGRTGIAAGPELKSLYGAIHDNTSTIAAGFHVYDGHLHDPDLEDRKEKSQAALAPVLELKAELEATGIPVPHFIAGGSPTFALHANNPKVTECSPGTTVLWDTGYRDDYPDLPFRTAATVLTRVISRLASDAVCVDLGHKAISADKAQPRVLFERIPDASFETHSEEHLVVRSPACADLKVGDHLRGIPKHICPTVALYDQAYVLDSTDQVIDEWPITARKRRLSI